MNIFHTDTISINDLDIEELIKQADLDHDGEVTTSAIPRSTTRSSWSCLEASSRSRSKLMRKYLEISSLNQTKIIS